MLFQTQCGYSRSAVFIYATVTGRGFRCSGKVLQGFSRPIPGIRLQTRPGGPGLQDISSRPWSNLNPIRQVIQRGTFELIAQSIPVDKWVTDKLPLNDLYQLKFEGQIFSGERVVFV